MREALRVRLQELETRVKEHRHSHSKSKGLIRPKLKRELWKEAGRHVPPFSQGFLPNL